MFQVYCAAHGSRVLLSASRITALRNCPDGVVIEWRCWCGHQGRSPENLHAHRDPAGAWPAAS
jgi:hypothetical protein